MSADLPGYTAGDAQVQDAQLTAAPSEGPCDRLFDRFGDPPENASSPTASFQASATGPFVVQTLTTTKNGGELQAARSALHDCATFRSDDLAVTVRQAAFPALGDETVALKLDATGGEGDDAETLGGYLVVVRVKDTVCTIVNYGMPGVEIADTETVVRKAVGKL